MTVNKPMTVNNDHSRNLILNYPKNESDQQDLLNMLNDTYLESGRARNIALKMGTGAQSDASLRILEENMLQLNPLPAGIRLTISPKEISKADSIFLKTHTK